MSTLTVKYIATIHIYSTINCDDSGWPKLAPWSPTIHTIENYYQSMQLLQIIKIACMGITSTSIPLLIYTWADKKNTTYPTYTDLPRSSIQSITMLIPCYTWSRSECIWSSHCSAPTKSWSIKIYPTEWVRLRSQWVNINYNSVYLTEGVLYHIKHM